MPSSLESFLAKLTGRSAWPSVKATVASHLLTPSETSIVPTLPEDETTDIFCYEVNGATYIKTISEVVGDTPLKTGDHVHIQYNPAKPSQCYYAPNNQLAARATVCAVIVATVALMALFIHFHH
jgi:hypothetical protein